MLFYFLLVLFMFMPIFLETLQCLFFTLSLSRLFISNIFSLRSLCSSDHCCHLCSSLFLGSSSSRKLCSSVFRLSLVLHCKSSFLLEDDFFLGLICLELYVGQYFHFVHGISMPSLLVSFI